jgi:hypothetical protein
MEKGLLHEICVTDEGNIEIKISLDRETRFVSAEISPSAAEFFGESMIKFADRAREIRAGGV